MSSATLAAVRQSYQETKRCRTPSLLPIIMAAWWRMTLRRVVTVDDPRRALERDRIKQPWIVVRRSGTLSSRTGIIVLIEIVLIIDNSPDGCGSLEAS